MLTHSDHRARMMCRVAGDLYGCLDEATKGRLPWWTKAWRYTVGKTRNYASWHLKVQLDTRYKVDLTGVLNDRMACRVSSVVTDTNFISAYLHKLNKEP